MATVRSALSLLACAAAFSFAGAQTAPAPSPSAQPPMNMGHPHGMNDHASDWATERLDKSPRHHEYVTLTHGGRKVNAFVVYPETSGKAPVVVLIHEIFGLTPWAKEMADEIAGAGYIVIAPDLLSGTAPANATGNTGTAAYPTQDDAVQAVSKLDDGQVLADLDSAADYGKKLPAANSAKLFVTGFCWGGGKSFLFATHRHDLTGAMVFYGPAPAQTQMTTISSPVYGFYAGNDARITSTVPQTTQQMHDAGKTYQPVIYPGAGHGFMRAGEAPDASAENAAARHDGFTRLIDLLGGVH